MQERLDARLRSLSPRGVHDLITKIAQIDEFRGWWKGRGLPSAAMLRRLKARATARSSVASAGIEQRDAARGRAAAQRARPGGRTPTPGSSPHAASVSGYAELLQAVFDGYREMELGVDLILRFHSRLLTYSPGDRGHRGKFRAIPDAATPPWQRRMELLALRPVDPDLTPRAMAAATEWAVSRLTASEFHPLLVIAGFVLEFLAIRPFVDGNGRLSRILTTLLLLRSGYTYLPYASLEAVIAERWTEYYFALRRSQANAALPRPDITPWLNAFVDAMCAQLRQLKAALEAPDDRRLSSNQLRVLSLLERNREVTNRQVCRELGLPKDTAKQIFNRLLALNMVRRLGAGRAARYRRSTISDE